MIEKIRLDKWLWSVRLFKSRTMASDAIKASKVSINNKQAKSSTIVNESDKVELRRNGFIFTYTVNTVIKTRVSAVLAAPCYTNTTPEDEMNKYKNWFVGKGGVEMRQRGTGRPTKRERREIDGYKEDNYIDPFTWLSEEE
jgi:ribosome-associated heat shock protein Hsp15